MTEFDSVVASLVDHSLNTSNSSIQSSLNSNNSISSSLVNTGEINDILANALRVSNMNQSFLDRQIESSPVNVTLVDERLLYLERAIASMQNHTYGYQEEIIHLKEQVRILETEISKFQQYNRRESVEISGIPESITQENLEKSIITVLRRVGGWGLEHYEIAACHRLGR